MTSDPPFTFDSPTQSELEIARTCVRDGELAEAEQIYQQVLTEQPDQVEALRFLANASLSRGDPGTAISMLSRAAQINRSDIGVLLELGLAYRSAQRMDEARSVFERTLELSHGCHTAARLLLANAYELGGRPEIALLQYFRAIIDAQANGKWLDDSTTEPGLRQIVKHAMQYVDTGRHNLFENVLESFRQGIDFARLGRIDTALATYLREKILVTADPRQKPTFLYIPDHDATCFLDTSTFEWLGNWSARASSLDGEALACINSIADESSGEALFSLDAMTTKSSSDRVPVATQRISFYHRGIFEKSIRTHAPMLSNMLDSASLARIANYSPNAEILALQPYIETPMRYGQTNAFCTIVVSFAGSSPLLVTVGNESQKLQAGQVLVFDSSFGFKYASGDAPARVLTFEAWNPGISPLERDALTALITAIVNFDSQLQDLA